MIARVERLPRPQPDIDNLLRVIRREKTSRVPMLELKLDDEVMADLLGEPLVKYAPNAPPDHRRRAIRQHTDLMYRLGYDAFRLRTGIPFQTIKDRTDDTADLSRGEREWQNEHKGPIQGPEDVDNYPWPTIHEVDFGPVEEILESLPEGMACIGYCSGVFEWSSWLMGLETFMIALYDMPEVVRAVVDRVGSLICQCFEVWARTDGVPILWLGDDLGFKTSTMIGADHLREYIFPWHARCAAVAHRAGKPFLLHCCGNITAVMPDLVEKVGIDAKHSFEDVIEPVEAFHRRWHSRIATIGGVDIDLLSRGSPEQVAARTEEILKACAPLGGYVAGSGNSVPNYVPTGNFLTMVETVHRFNGRM